VALFICPPAEAGDKSAEIIDLIQTYHTLGRFNGTALIAVEGDIVAHEGYGLANMEWEIPNDTLTKFRLGSITKQFTSMLIMQQVERGAIALDAVIADYLPYYRSDIGRQVTIHQLLTHTSGIPSYTTLDDYDQISRNSYGVEEFVTNFCSNDLEFEPGTEFSYSNSGYFILGAILESVTGQSYESLLHAMILDPIGMNSSGYDHNNTILSKRADGYYPTAFGFRNEDYTDMSVPYSAGAMYSTASDLLRWDQALSGSTLLSPELQRIMFTPHPNGYAYGWWREMRPCKNSEDSLDLAWHIGGIRGFYSIITRELTKKYLIVLLNNTAKFDASDLRSLTDDILCILGGEPYTQPKMTGTERLLEILRNSGASTMVSEYGELRKLRGAQFDIRPIELDWLGNELLSGGFVDDAIALLKLVVDQYPDFPYAHETLGDAYQQTGNRSAALTSYRQALKLQPERKDIAHKISLLE